MESLEQKRSMFINLSFTLSDAKGGTVLLYHEGSERTSQQQKIRGLQQDAWGFSGCFYDCMLRTGNGGASPYEKLALGIAGRSSDSIRKGVMCDMIRNLGVTPRQWCCMACYWMIFQHVRVCFFFVIHVLFLFLYRRHMINLKQQAVIVHCTTQIYRQQYVACQLYRHDFSNDVVSAIKHGIITHFLMSVNLIYCFPVSFFSTTL